MPIPKKYKISYYKSSILASRDFDSYLFKNYLIK